MNIERISTLANHIEALAPEAFDMTRYWMQETGCGTPACIAGHAITLFREGKPRVFLPEAKEAAELLGLDEDFAFELFHPGDREWEAVTPLEASLVLRNLIWTGKVQWKPEFRA